MTASTVKSSSITGFDSVPVTLVQGSKQGNKAKEYKETYEVATTSIDEIGDIIKMIRLPSRLRVSEIILYNDDLDSNGTPALTVNIGLYNSKDGTVVDADCFASEITTLQAANTVGVNVCNEAGDIANIGKQIWEYCSGVTSDPQVPLDLALTVAAAAGTAAAGTISIVVRGSLDN